MKAGITQYPQANANLGTQRQGVNNAAALLSYDVSRHEKRCGRPSLSMIATDVAFLRLLNDQEES
jgi:hypothetical protein